MSGAVRAGVVGVSGYIGGEIARSLLSHSRVVIGALAGIDSAGRSLGDVHPQLRGAEDVKIQKLGDADLTGCDVAFLALGSGESMKALSAMRSPRRGIRIRRW